MRGASKAEKVAEIRKQMEALGGDAKQRLAGAWRPDAPDGVIIEELGRRSRGMRLAKVSCEACGFEAVVPVPVARSAEWPSACTHGAMAEALAHAQRCAVSLRIQKLVANQEQATGALSRRLVDEGFDEVAVCEGISKAQEYGWLDDARFAESFARAKRGLGWGAVRIEHELKSKGIDPQLAYEAACGGDEAQRDEGERAYRLLTARGVRGPNERQKLYRRLLSKGYAPGVASAAINRYMREREARSDERGDA